MEFIGEEGGEVIFEVADGHGGRLTISSRKGGVIHRAWQEGRIQSSGVQDLAEGEPIGIGPSLKFVPEEIEEAAGQELPRQNLPLERDRGRELLEAEERAERLGIEWRLEALRAQLAKLPYCNHAKDFCSGECELRAELIALEKRLLGDP
jgi:hypothetical protein